MRHLSVLVMEILFKRDINPRRISVVFVLPKRDGNVERDETFCGNVTAHFSQRKRCSNAKHSADSTSSNNLPVVSAESIGNFNFQVSTMYSRITETPHFTLGAGYVSLLF